jgi:hypothetical protein
VGCVGGFAGSKVPAPTAVASPTIEAGSPIPVPSSTPFATPEATDQVVEDFVPPEPLCPAPPVAVEAPRLLASVGEVSVLMNTGSSSVLTCSTSGSTDVIPVDPVSPLQVSGNDVIRLTLPPGWNFLYWEGSDHPLAGEGANVTPGGATPARPTFIDIPSPTRLGSSIAIVAAWVISADGRVVASIEGSVLVER